MESVRNDWAFVGGLEASRVGTEIWTHGLTSSVESEDEGPLRVLKLRKSVGGWPFAGVASLSRLLPVVRYDARGHGRSDLSEPCTWKAGRFPTCRGL